MPLELGLGVGEPALGYAQIHHVHARIDILGIKSSRQEQLPLGLSELRAREQVEAEGGMDERLLRRQSDGAFEVAARRHPVVVELVQYGTHQRVGRCVTGVELQGMVQRFGRMVGGGSWVTVPPDGKVEPRAAHADESSHIVGRLAQCSVEARQCSLKRRFRQRLSQKVLSAFHHVPCASGCGDGLTVASAQGRNITAYGKADLQRGVAALVTVVPSQPLPQPPGLDANDGVARRVERFVRPPEDFDRQYLLLQRAAIAGNALLDQVSKELLMAAGPLERTTAGDAREFRLDEFVRNAGSDQDVGRQLESIFVVGHGVPGSVLA